jgi:hypothetical protein
VEPPIDYESWLIDEGDAVIHRKASVGLAQLSTWERAVYYLWVADYSVRNAGDLQAAHGLEAEFKSAGLQAARALRLPAMSALFSYDDGEFVRRYDETFDRVCAELADSRTSAPEEQ